MINCTLIIPLHNNQNYLTRSIEYFRSSEIKVIYVDSSDKKAVFPLAKNMSYLYLPNKNFPVKMLYAFKQAKTDFIACCALDDFLLIRTIVSGLKLMNLDSKIVSVVGRYYFFHKDNMNRIGRLYSHDKKWKYKEGDKDFNTKSFLSNYYMILWALYKKEIIIYAYKAVNEAFKNKSVNNDNFIEFILATILSYKGKIEFVPKFWGLREAGDPGSWGRLHKNIIGCSDKEINLVIGTINSYTRPGIGESSFKSYEDCVRRNKTSYFKRLLINKFRLGYLLGNKITSDEIKKVRTILLNQN